MSILKTLLKLATEPHHPRRVIPPHPYFHPPAKSSVKRQSFAVTSHEISSKMYNWYANCAEAHEEVATYVYKTLNKGATLGNFEYDMDGRLWRTAFTGIQPDGWRGGGYNDQWLYAESYEAQRELRSLPKLPSRAELHDLIDWPTLNENHYPKEAKQAARLANNQVYVSGDTNTGETYVHVPLPENFEQAAQVQLMAENWFEIHKPDFLNSDILHPQPPETNL